MTAQTKGVGVLVAGRPIYRTTTHVVASNNRILSQHRSEKAAVAGLALRRGCTNFEYLKVLPVDAALARVGGAAVNKERS